jgi:hypothetical protein
VVVDVVEDVLVEDVDVLVDVDVDVLVEVLVVVGAAVVVVEVVVVVGACVVVVDVVDVDVVVVVVGAQEGQFCVVQVMSPGHAYTVTPTTPMYPPLGSSRQAVYVSLGPRG